MKKLSQFLVAMLLCSVVTTSCQQDEVQPPNTSTNSSSSSSNATTGTMSFHVESSGQGAIGPVVDATVGLSHTLQDGMDEIYFATGTTDSNGDVSFSSVTHEDLFYSVIVLNSFANYHSLIGVTFSSSTGLITEYVPYD